MSDTVRWHTIVEHDAPASPYDENLADHPGVGHCTRDDGAGGPLVDLIPDGWRLIDFGCVVTGPNGQHDRLYVACPDDVLCWREHASPSRRWRVDDARLRLDND